MTMTTTTKVTRKKSITNLLFPVIILIVVFVFIATQNHQDINDDKKRSRIHTQQLPQHQHDDRHHYGHRQLQKSANNNNNNNGDNKKIKILYTITTLAEFDKGDRATQKGFDRLKGTLIPVMLQSVNSMLSFGYDVDVYLVCHYKMEREQLVRDSLPDSVGLRVWSEAAPISYMLDSKLHPNETMANTRALARQHRFVVKDNLFDYDFFACFEDDMIINGYHIQNYLEMTQELYKLRETAPDDIPDEIINQRGDLPFYGTLTKSQLKRIFPGLIRVEVLLNEAKYATQSEGQRDPVPVAKKRPQVDPKPCCHVSKETTASASRPEKPESDKIFLWETGITALGVRQMPTESSIGWVVLQRGPRVDFKNLTISDYWSGKDHKFKEGRPRPNDFSHVNNQGGWMATRQQIWEWHTEICPGGFLPPYEAPHYRFDGLDLRNVEYWSGGLSLFTARHACNMQRIISLDPDKFARHLVYHSANNKQRQLQHKKCNFVKVNDFLGQLHTVQDLAETEMNWQLSVSNK